MTPPAWIVETGYVDLFLAPVTTAGTYDRLPANVPALSATCPNLVSPGPRSHIARIEKGSLFLEIDASTLPNGWIIFAQSTPETKLRSTDLASVPAKSIESWLSLLAGVITRNGAEPGRVQPLSPEVVAEIARDLRTPAALHEDSSRAGLEQFHRIFGRTLVLAHEAAEAKERLLLEARRSEDESGLNAALHQLMAPLSRAAGEQALQPHTTDPLLKACRAIGVVQGINFKASPDFLRNLTAPDPLSALCRSAGARHRRVALGGDWYRRAGQPLLAYRESDGRPLALLSGRSRSYSVYDPVTGSRTKVDRDLADSLRPFAYCFYRGFPPTPVKLKDLCLFGLRGCWRDLALVFTLALLVGLMGMVLPVLTRDVFDVIIPGGRRNSLMGVAVFILAASLASTLIGLTRGFALLRIENQVEAGVQAAIWMRLLSLPAAFFRQFSVGDLEARAAAIGTIRQMLTSSALSVLFAGIFSIGNFALLFYYSVPLALVATILTIVQLTAFLGLAIAQLQIQRASLDVQGRLYGLLLQLIANISKFRVSATENRAFMAWSRIFVAYRRRGMRSARVSNGMAVVGRVFSIVSSMAIFWITSKITTGSKAFTTGDFMAFMSAYGSFSGALMSMGQVGVGLVATIPLYRRVKPILNALPESDPSKQVAGELAGHIEMRNVSFRYRKDGPQVLKNISLSVAPGEFVAIVGPSGSGKSTVARLLLGLERPDSGAIFYDGQDIATLDIASLRQQMGVVMQNSNVFSGDIYSNVASSTQCTVEEAWQAARVAALDDDLKAMPMGMHTVLGEAGVGLSGGQRQRLMIARAVAGKPRVLLLDEATSALDNRTQDKVSQNLRQLRSTRVVIAHRLTTVMNADRIFMIDNGLLVQSGSYQELSARPGPFAEFVKRQLT
jgi:NHLM bacteriocin system ABC transporter ATP-binding protein